MPQPRDVAKYPREFLEIAERFTRDTSPFHIQFLTIREAMRTRFRLYGFKEALMNDPGVGESPFSAFLATEIGLQEYRDGKAALLIRMPEDAPAVAAVRAALASSGASLLGGDVQQAQHSEGSLAPAVGADGSAVDKSVEEFLRAETERRKEPRDED